MKEKITVAVMAWNERASVEPVVRGAHAELSSTGHDFEVLIIDDGSTDGTGEAAEQLAAELSNVRVVHHPKNLGLGGVYRTGFDEFRGDLLTFMPADGQFPPDTISKLLAGIVDHDLAIGWLPNHKRPPVGRLLSFIERALFTILLGPLPKFQGMFMVRRKVVKELPLVSSGRGWAIVMELMIRAARKPYRLASVGTELRPRAAGQSKVQNVRTIWANTKQLIALRKLLREFPS